LNQFHERLAAFGDIEDFLDALTPPLLGEQTYREYVARFEREPYVFLPSVAPLDSEALAAPADGGRGASPRVPRRVVRRAKRPFAPRRDGERRRFQTLVG
jgi:hypothetical protein